MPAKKPTPTKPEPPVNKQAGHKPDVNYGTAADIKELWIYVQGNKVENVRERVIQDGCKIKLTIDGASTITLSLDDWDRKILRGKNIIRHQSQVFLQDRWWTLVQGQKNGDQLDLTFEDAHVANMRTYGKVLLVPKSWGSRCQFVWRLVLEAAATDKSLNFEAPCVGKQIPQKLVDSVLGLQEPKSPYIRDPYVAAKPKGKIKIKIDGADPTNEQLDNINVIMSVCQDMNVRRKVAVAAIMTGIHESSIRNLDWDQSPLSSAPGYQNPLFPIGSVGHRGVWQQDPRYWPASGNVKTDAVGDGHHKGFVTVANEVDHQRPNWSVNQVCNQVQYPGGGSDVPFFGPGGQFRKEAETIVTAWGWSGGDIRDTVPNPSSSTKAAGSQTDVPPIVIPPGFTPQTTGAGTNTQWHRGSPKKKKGVRQFLKENTWTCIQRMASEVNWYAFMLGDYLVFAPGDWLFSKPQTYRFKEFQTGVGYIDFDYDVNKKNATVTIHTRMNEWPVDPGNVITLEDMGIVDGQWLVSAYERSLFSHEVTVTCVKPKPKLTEAEAIGSVAQQPSFGGELKDPNSKYPKANSPIKVRNIRAKIGAWARSGAKGPPPRYGDYSGGYKGKPGYWPPKMDCSDFVVQCFAWGSDFDETYDPNQNNWADGNTRTMYPNGADIQQGQVQVADVVIWSAGIAVGGSAEHTAVFIEDWHGEDTEMVSHGGGTPGPSITTYKNENAWHVARGANPTIKNYMGD